MPLALPRKVGVCKVPPEGLHWDEYNPGRDGPLVNCKYATASYEVGYDEYISYDNRPYLRKYLTRTAWNRLPQQVVLKHGVVDRNAIFNI
jgi:hypothetical protein